MVLYRYKAFIEIQTITNAHYATSSLLIRDLTSNANLATSTMQHRFFKAKDYITLIITDRNYAYKEPVII